MGTFLKIEDAALEMSCSKRTVQRMVAAGDLQYIEVGLGNRKSIRVKLPEPKTKTQQRDHRRARRKEYVGSVLKMP